MEESDNLVAAQFSGDLADNHRLILEVENSNLHIKDSVTEPNHKITSMDLSFKEWARLYWLFVKPDGKKSWITRKIEESDFYKSLE